jgi:hypothetical protein
MKKTACVKLFALAIIAVSMGGQAEARSRSDGHHNSDQRTASRSTPHEGRGAFREARGSAHEGRGSFHEARSVVHSGRGGFHEARSGFFEPRSAGRSFFHAEGRGRSRMVAWQSYGRFQHASLSGRSSGHVGYSGGGGIQCVTFARADSGIELSGNARDWWANAAGVYQRGSRPEAGSVLNFRANGSMRMGHVAVVNQVVDGRTLIVDHANWGGPGAVRGGVSRDISVVDVSPANDWSAVRVGLGHSGEYGSIYPTYGFIYNRPDGGTILASADTGTALPALNPAPRDLRPREAAVYDEVAEAPDSAMPVYGRHASRHRRHGITLVSHRGPSLASHHGFTLISHHVTRHRHGN